MLAEMPLSSGHAGTLQTVKKVRALIRQGREDPLVRQVASEVVRAADVEPRDQTGEAEALFEFVRGHLRFTRDPVGTEMLSTARSLLTKYQDADCDEYVILLGSLLESIGIQVRAKIVKKQRRGPWKHIYLEALLHGQWTPLDATHPHQPMGWEVDYGAAFTATTDGRIESDEDLGQLDLIGGLVGAGVSLYQQHKAEKAQKEAADDAKKLQKKQLEAQEKQNKAALEIANAQVAAQKEAAEASRTQAAAQLAAVQAGIAKEAAAATATTGKFLGLDWTKLPKWAPYAAAGLGALLVLRILR